MSIVGTQTEFLFTIFTWPIIHLVPLPPKKILHNPCLRFFPGLTVILQEKLVSMVMQSFFFLGGGGLTGGGMWGLNRVHYGVCENGQF